MPWKPGQSGNPGGRPSYSLISQALREYITEERAHALAVHMYEVAMTNERIAPAVMSIIFDRAEGKLKETLDLNHGTQQSTVVLLPRNGREAPLQLTASGEVLEAELQMNLDDPCEMFIEEGEVLDG